MLLLLPGVLDARTAAEIRLEAVTTSEPSGQTQLVLEFNALPHFRVENSGQRVDLILPGATLASTLRGQPESGRVIKVLYAKKKDELVVSFLLRQPPARILTSTEDSRRLVLELFWQPTPTRTAIAFQVPGLPTMQGSRASATVKPASKYSGSWERFFREYRTPLVIQVSPRYSGPSLPAGVAEAQAKRYLECHAMASSGDSYQAKIALQELLASLDERHPLLPYGRLLQAEIALATGGFGEAVSLLKKSGGPWPAAVEPRRQACLAAALAKTGSTDQAIRTYRALGDPLAALSGQPLLLENAAAIFFAQGEYSTAATLYRALAEQLSDPAQQALARLGWAFSAGQEGLPSLAQERLKQIKETSPAEEAGQRAHMRLLDYGVLTGGEAQYPAALSGYGILARKAVLKELREEATLKLALILAWSSQQERSVNHLQGFLREFRGGALRGEAEALLLELLPPVIQDLVARGEDLQAVVLVEKNRQLLMNGELGWTFLLELASAFSRLGLPERASRIYLFMLDSPRAVAEKEMLYLPMAQLFWEQEDYLQAGNYAAQYLERYPQGRYRAHALLWNLRALRETGRLPEAASLLRSTKMPWDKEVELEAARILTAVGDYRLLTEIVGWPEGRGESATETLMLQAEALRETGREALALPLFRRLMEEESFADQAAFRYAQIRLAQGEKKEALKILTRLVETGKSQLWRRLAEDTLRAAAT
jgi:TolA-binding protein